RPPDKAKGLALGTAFGAYLLSRLYMPWMIPLFDRFVDGDSDKGNRVGFFVTVSSVGLGLALILIAGRCWRSSTVRGRIVGVLAGVTAIAVSSLFAFGLPGRGPWTAPELVFERALPGVYAGTVAALVSLVVGVPLALFLWDLGHRRHRSLGEGRR
ncbi:MAG: hypothetical protein ACRDV9_05215, partial [Acidimicrobiia bacterium]